MNERIRQLAEKANIEFTYDPTETPMKAFAECWADELEKFAELIVQECGNWFNSRLVVEPDYGMEHRIERNRAVVGVMKEFNQHFGVEEPEE
jgi:hypothetical protein